MGYLIRQTSPGIFTLYGDDDEIICSGSKKKCTKQMYRLDECNYKSFSARDFKRVLKKNGYKKIRQTGSHEIYKKDNRTISVPGIKLNRMIARRLIKENNLEV